MTAVVYHVASVLLYRRNIAWESFNESSTRKGSRQNENLDLLLLAYAWEFLRTACFEFVCPPRTSGTCTIIQGYYGDFTGHLCERLVLTH
jgi:hypothetical protein